MTRAFKLTLLAVCALPHIAPCPSALAQDQFNNNTVGKEPATQDQFYNNGAGNAQEERDGWEYTGDPYNNTGQYKWCHAKPGFRGPEGPNNRPLICLNPGEKPPYLLKGNLEVREGTPGMKTPSRAPDAPFDPYAPGVPLQPVSPQKRASPQKPLHANAGQGSNQPAGNRQINPATSSYVFLAGATRENCQLKGTRKIGKKGGGYEELFICLGPDHYDGQGISGSITSVDGGSRFFKTVGGTFREGPGGRQPTFEIDYLNGEPVPGRIMTVPLE